MNEEIKEFLTKIINSEPKKGMIVNGEVKEIYGKDIMTINTHVEGDFYALVKILVAQMSLNEKLRNIIRAVSFVSKNVLVDAIKLPSVSKEEKGGKA